MSDYPSWQPIETAPKGGDILAVWECEPNGRKEIGLAYYNGFFEVNHPGSGFWVGYTSGGAVSSRSGKHRPIAWMYLPEIT